MVSGSAGSGSGALLGPASSCWTILTALSGLGMPDLRELVKPVVDPGDKRPTSSSGVAERGSENDVTPDCRQAELVSESDSKPEPAIE